MDAGTAQDRAACRHLDGRGSWRLPRRLRGGDEQAARRTQLSFELDIRNAGALLDRMGLPHTLRDDRGKLEGRVGWLGSPLSMDYPACRASCRCSWTTARSSPSSRARRACSACSACKGCCASPRSTSAACPARGTVFDTISGNGTIANGIGTISDFRLKGSQLNATMTGSADLLRETQDLRVAVVPRINATSTSVAAAFVNPALGIGTLAAQLLFADEFSASRSTTTSSAAGPACRSIKWRTIGLRTTSHPTAPRPASAPR